MTKSLCKTNIKCCKLERISKYEPLKTKLNIKDKIIFVVYNLVLKLRIKFDNRK